MMFSNTADTPEKRNEWVQAINNIRTAMYNKMFKVLYESFLYTNLIRYFVCNVVSHVNEVLKFSLQ